MKRFHNKGCEPPVLLLGVHGLAGGDGDHVVDVVDRHSAYFTLNFLNHQVCVAHLLRELQYLNELDKEQQWSRNVESLLQQAVHERNENPQAIIDKQPWLIKLDGLLTENLEHMAEPSSAGTTSSTSSRTRRYLPIIMQVKGASER